MQAKVIHYQHNEGYLQHICMWCQWETTDLYFIWWPVTWKRRHVSLCVYALSGIYALFSS